MGKCTLLPALGLTAAMGSYPVAADPTKVKTLPDQAPAILTIKSDPEYAAYLASECITCHQRDGSDQGIPIITHWPIEDFVAAMLAYKDKQRPHPVMQMISGRLSNDEIAVLAVYFATHE